jgi:hypothetical protein
MALSEEQRKQAEKQIEDTLKLLADWEEHLRLARDPIERRRAAKAVRRLRDQLAVYQAALEHDDRARLELAEVAKLTEVE